MTQEELNAAIKSKDTPFHQSFLKECISMLERSKTSMGRYYSTWDEADRVFRTRTIVDEQDRKSAQRREPTKLLLPFTRAQILTFVSFGFLQLTQRDTFYELQSDAEEDELGGTQTNPLDGSISQNLYSPERDAETVLARDVRRNRWLSFLNQTLLDVGRFGITIGKIGWEEKTAMAPSPTADPAGISAAGEEVPEQVSLEVESTVLSQGNKVMRVSPYNFYPDVTLPITRFQEGEYCASEDIFSYTRLKKDEAEGLIVGLDDVKPLTDVMQHLCFKNSRWQSSFGVGNNLNIKGDLRNADSSKRHGSIVVSEMERWLVPKETMIGETPMGPESEPKMYIIKIGNWSRILSITEAGYDHQQFNYVVGQFTEDTHMLLNEGLAELVAPLQETATWFINSHIKNVKQQLYGGLLAVDQGQVEMSDLQNRSPVIRMKPGAMARGIDNVIKQIPITDSTSNHVNDVETLWKFVQVLSGASENAMGQYSGGRRDATQSRAVNQGAAARLKTVISVLWESFYEPAGRQMLFNLQQSLTLETFQKIVGKKADQARFDSFCKRNIGPSLDDYDFNVFDGTLPSEKGYIAQSMQEIFLSLMENPMGVQLLATSQPLRLLLVELAELRGIKNPERFLPPMQPPNAINMPVPGQPGASPVSQQPPPTEQMGGA